MNAITLKQVGYKISGTATLNLWGGGQGEIEMKEYQTKTKKDAEILKGINDNGFGCESIEKVKVFISKLYEHDLAIYDDDDDREYKGKKLQSAMRGI